MTRGLAADVLLGLLHAAAMALVAAAGHMAAMAPTGRMMRHWRSMPSSARLLSLLHIALPHSRQGRAMATMSANSQGSKAHERSRHVRPLWRRPCHRPPPLAPPQVASHHSAHSHPKQPRLGFHSAHSHPEQPRRARRPRRMQAWHHATGRPPPSATYRSSPPPPPMRAARSLTRA